MKTNTYLNSPATPRGFQFLQVRVRRGILVGREVKDMRWRAWRSRRATRQAHAHSASLGEDNL